MYKQIIGIVLIAACFLLSCSGNKTPGANGSDSSAIVLQRNKQTALTSKLAFLKNDLNTVFKNCAPGFQDYGSGTAKPEKKY
jgi:hypothetical protein